MNTDSYKLRILLPSHNHIVAAQLNWYYLPNWVLITQQMAAGG